MIVDMPITERMKLVVDAVRTAQLTYLKGVNNKITTVRYDHGRPLNIINRLIQLNNPPQYQFDKYPGIFLFQDFTETESGKAGSLRKVRVQMIIANQAELNQTEAERYVVNFKQILYPLYDELIRQLANSSYFLSAGRPIHDKIDHPYWGKEGLYGNIANTATDELDCIEIRNLELTIGRARRC